MSLGHLEESTALDCLHSDESGKANHGGSAIDHFSGGSERTEGFGLSTLEDRDKGGSREENESEDNASGLISKLAEHRLARRELSEESSNKTKHGQASIDDFWGSAERHDVAEAGSLDSSGGDGGGRGGLSNSAIGNSCLELQPQKKSRGEVRKNVGDLGQCE